MRRALGVFYVAAGFALASMIIGCGVPVRGDSPPDSSGRPSSAEGDTGNSAGDGVVGPVTAFAVGDTNNAAPAGRFTIVGRDIVDPTGRRFYPIGANVAVRQGPFETGYIFNWNGTATDHAADVQAWGWNIVRANLICVPPGSPNATQMNDGIDAFIAEYTALGIVVMVDCHDVTGRDYGPADPQITALYPFWEGLAQRWKNNPYVWFNMFNEPVSGASPAQVENWLALQQSALARLRAIAPHNIFVADIPGYGQAAHTFTGPNSVTRLGAGQCNVLYAWHAYGALGNNGTFGDVADYADESASRENHLEALTFVRDNNIPVVIGELGDPLTLDQGTAGQPIWNRNAARAVIDLAPQFGVGMLWWHATGDSGNSLYYSLMQDNHTAPWSAATTGTGLSDGGTRFWNASKNAPDLGPFTGDLSASNCGAEPPTSTTSTSTTSTSTSTSTTSTSTSTSTTTTVLPPTTTSTTSTTSTTTLPPTTTSTLPPTSTTSTSTSTSVPVVCVAQRLEAESAVLYRVQVDRNWTPYSGSGVVGWFDAVGDSVTWNVTVPSAGTYRLSWRYATTRPNWTRSVEVDGVRVGSVGAGSTTAWNRYADTVPLSVSLTAGTHQVSLAYRSTDREYINIDYLTVGCDGGGPPSTSTSTTSTTSTTTTLPPTSTSTSTTSTTSTTTTTSTTSSFPPTTTTSTSVPVVCVAQRLEAESAVLYRVQVDRNWTPYSGSGVIGWFDAVGDSVTWNVTVPSAGTYRLSWRYATTRPNWTRSVEVDGVRVGSVGAGSTTAWNRYADTVPLSVSLTAGTHQVSLAYRSTDREYINIDYLTVGCPTT